MKGLYFIRGNYGNLRKVLCEMAKRLHMVGGLECCVCTVRFLVNEVVEKLRKCSRI
jgi:hypothetical protein